MQGRGCLDARVGGRGAGTQSSSWARGGASRRRSSRWRLQRPGHPTSSTSRLFPTPTSMTKSNEWQGITTAVFA